MGSVNSISDIFADQQFQARGNLARVEAEGVGEVVVPGVVTDAFRKSGSDRESRTTIGQCYLRSHARFVGARGGRNRAAPEAENTFDHHPAISACRRQLTDPECDNQRLAMMRENETELPLAGIRVIDTATVIAGPYCASILGEFGAEVIKVEHPLGGDPLRRFGTPTARGDTLTWLSEARNKRSVTLDLHDAAGRGTVQETDREIGRPV